MTAALSTEILAVCLLGRFLQFSGASVFLQPGFTMSGADCSYSPDFVVGVSGSIVTILLRNLPSQKRACRDRSLYIKSGTGEISVR